MDETLLRLLRPVPHRTFLTRPDGRRLTYGEFLALSARIAHALAELGVTPGDRVAVQVDKSPEALALYMACLRRGAVFLPLNTAYTLAELAYFIGDAEPRLVVCRPGLQDELGGLAAARLPGARAETLDADGAGTLLAHASGKPETFGDAPVTGEDLAAILYTSGTTGRSKGAMLTHANLASNALTLREAWRFTADDVLLHALPIYHTHGLFVATNTVMLAGAAMLFLPRFDADEVIRLLPHATVLMGVPTFYTRLLQHPGLTRESAAHMRLFVSGSAPLLAATHRAFEERTGHAILERYGMTETNMNTSNPYEGPRRAGTVGRPLPGVELRITERGSGRALPAGEIGMIEVRGPNVFKGYWRNPEKTAEELRADGFFVTGDLGQLDEDGYVRIVGRDKDLIISGGLNVYPKEVETVIDGIEGVAESAVIGLPHPDLGEGVAAVVVPERGAALSEPDILDAIATKLARFKQPRRVFFADSLPRNAMGKVQKSALRERYAEAHGRAEA